jgi:hypothetical protein
MKATTVICTIFISIFIFTNIQAQETKVLTEEQNNEWINSLMVADLQESLDIIKQRIQADSDVFYISTRNPHGKDRVEQGYHEQSYCRPLYVFFSEGKKPVFIKPNPDNAMVNKLQKFLKPGNIAEVEIENGTRALAIYGSRASCGVIKMQIRDEKDYTRLEDLLK